MGKIRTDQEVALKDQEAARAAEKKNEPSSPSPKGRGY